ncbi:hypothetical protein [Streptomyces cyaneofuscatus]|uniref:hypothetical protein n=1 Tax=Streptomyces cyaneofuscatus TaxID=66883 RepID=UPI0033B83735
MRPAPAAVTLAAVFLLTTACSGTDASGRHATEPSPSRSHSPATTTAELETAVRVYSEANFAPDADKAYGMLSQRCAAAVSRDVLGEPLDAAAASYDHPALRTITVDHIRGAAAQVSYTYDDPALAQTGQEWLRENGRWKADMCPRKPRS